MSLDIPRLDEINSVVNETVEKVMNIEQAEDYSERRASIQQLRQGLQGYRRDLEKPHNDALLDIRDSLGPTIAQLRSQESALRRVVDAYKGRTQLREPVAMNVTRNGNRRGLLNKLKEVLKQWR